MRVPCLARHDGQDGMKMRGSAEFNFFNLTFYF